VCCCIIDDFLKDEGICWSSAAYLIRLSEQRRPVTPARLFSPQKKRKVARDYHDPEKILMRQFGFVFSSIVNVWNGRNVLYRGGVGRSVTKICTQIRE
jgi:hypothetical protein